MNSRKNKAPVAFWINVLDSSNDGIAELSPYGTDCELCLIKSQGAGVALPWYFAAVDSDGPLIEIAGQRMRRCPRQANARYHSSLSISGVAQSGVVVVAIRAFMTYRAHSLTRYYRAKGSNRSNPSEKLDKSKMNNVITRRGNNNIACPIWRLLTT
jgi:hypothetical protein